MVITDELLTAINSDIDSIISQYKDVSADQLANTFGINMTAKNAYSALIGKLLSSSGSSAFSQLLKDENFVVKTIRLDKYGRLKESMSLPTFKYQDIVTEEWETRSLREYFSQKVFAFIVFRADGKELFLHNMMIWKMPSNVLETGVRPAWQSMHDLLENGSIVKYIDDAGRYFTFFPSSTENPYVHVRPHAQSRNDTYPLPVADKLTGLVCYPKHSFWLNRAYVLKIISKEER